LFKKNTGITINDCITQVRMKKAMELIKQSDIKLYDIAGMVGYSDSSYFTKIFKKQVGITPSEFREMY
jgi:two-component system response regulator YesN